MRACASAARPPSILRERYGLQRNSVPARSSSRCSATRARAISQSCTIRIFCAPRDCPCRPGWSGSRRSSRRSSKRECMPTDCLFREDAYLTSTPATVLGLTEKGGIVVDRTCFYATSGGQPGDSGMLVTPAGEFPLATAVYNDQLKTEIAHIPAETVGERPAVGENVTLKLDWGPRYRRMRMHTALHLLSAVLPYPVTGGAVNEDDSRLDFDIPEAGLDKDEITAKVNEMIKADAEVRSRWITDEELEANPGLVKTMAVKPPIGTGRVRLIEIDGFDLQPCGGTHVRRTGEIGAVRVTQIEKKGKQNRRVRISFA